MYLCNMFRFNNRDLCMNKILFSLSIIVGLLLVPMALEAQQITNHVAKEKALQFLSRYSALTRSEEVSLCEAKSDDGYYAFNIGNGNGFVLVSGDDRVNDIIGYATRGSFDLYSMPASMRSWMKYYSKTLTNLPENSRKVTHKLRQPIANLLQTYWDQQGPYALQCPKVKQPGEKDSPEYETPAGCVATAMAQIINYYRWPQSLPALPGYTTGSLEIAMPALPAAAINYDILRPYYFLDEMKDYQESAEEVSKLMRYCGQSCQMDYHPMGSGAGFTIETMSKYWGYTKKAKSLYRPNYRTVEEWEDIIYNELEKNHPVPYGGMNYQDGHQFICDGYDGNGFFHLNFGWQGSDGYFDLSICDRYRGMDSTVFSDNGYCSQQRAIVGLEPAKTDENGVEIEYDPIAEQNGEVVVNSIEMGKPRAGHYYSLVRLNVTGKSDIEIANLYLFLDGEMNAQTTVYLANEETREVYMHVLGADAGLHRISICSDSEGKRVLAATETEFVTTDSQNNLSVSANILNAENGQTTDDFIKVHVVINNRQDTPYDDEFHFVLSRKHEVDALMTTNEFRRYIQLIMVPANSSIEFDLVFDNLPQGDYLMSPFYFSDTNFVPGDQYWWVTLSGANGINNLKDDSQKRISYTTVDGVRYSKPQKGLNIIRHSDGTVKKIIVK